MKQVIQNFKTGDLFVDEVPPPSLAGGMVLVANRYSLISAGTERSTVKVAKAGLLGKARQRPDLVAQVLQNIKKEGLKATLEKVKTKLDTLKALGYSTAGEVIAYMDDDHSFRPGDRVACAGQDYASHAEIVSVPRNLVARIPDNVSFEEASFTTLGAIALQGVRQADPRLGEKVAVIGLGLLGQITCQLLKAAGCRVAGIDISEKLLELARELGADAALHRNDTDLTARLNAFTQGHGFDSIIITAAADSNDPIELAGEIARKKGRVVVVGAVRMEVPRDPHYYRKELDLRMSCSYGPGRYDPSYEEHGQDYPYGYVRWTEQRNMEAFLDLIAQGKVNVKRLISHVFDIENAAAAYDIVLGKVKEPHSGILLKYTPGDQPHKSIIRLSSGAAAGTGGIHVGVIGAGSFAQNYLIPYMRSWGAHLTTVVTSRGITAKNVAGKFSFANASSDSQDIFSDRQINTIFIATPHNTHAEYVEKALQAGKSVFVEKPLALNAGELEAITQQMEQHGGRLMVGFNRRFSPVANALKSAFGRPAQPLVINYRVNAGFIPKEHLIQDPATGGGRIVGEACHFIDLMQYFTGSLPIKVYASCINGDNDKLPNEDNVCIIIHFSDGSIGTLTYVASGDKSLPKERVEIFGDGKVGIIDDFKKGELHQNNKVKTLNLQGKGHKEEVQAFLQAVSTGGPMPVDFESIRQTTAATFKILDSLRTGLPQTL